MEDPFGALDDAAFDDNGDISREARLRAAFEESKRSYNSANDLIIVEPGVRPTLIPWLSI